MYIDGSDLLDYKKNLSVPLLRVMLQMVRCTNCSKGIRVSVELASLATVYQALYPNVAFEHAPMAHENFSCT